MSIVWVLEEAAGEKLVQKQLLGSVALRSIASIRSFETLMKIIDARDLPDIVVVNGEDFDWRSLTFQGEILVYSSDITELSSNKRVCLCNRIEDIPFTLLTLTKKLKKEKFRIDHEDLSLVCCDSGLRVSLSLKEAQIVQILLENCDEIIDRDYITAKAWQGASIARSTFDSQMSRVRKKLEGSGLHIESFYGGGYSLKGAE